MKRLLRRIVLYTKPGCHLCDEALELMLGLIDEMKEEFVIEQINILEDPALYARFRHTIPVISIEPDKNGPVLLAPITDYYLRRALSWDESGYDSVGID